MKFLRILSILLTALTVLIWLAFMLFYVASSTSDDVTIGMGIVLSAAGKNVSAVTIITGLIVMAVSKREMEKISAADISASIIGTIAFASISLLYP